MFARGMEKIMEFLFPPACPVCGAPVSIHGELCADCFGCFDWIDAPKCVRCGYPLVFAGVDAHCPVCAAGEFNLGWLRSACRYDEMSRSVMLPFKHGGRIRYARFMSRAMIWALRDAPTNEIDVVMPVPLARPRLVHRTYNQATLLARPIARAMNVPLDVDSVRRRHRPDMGHMTPRQRRENIRGVFSVAHPGRIRDRNILLVDDVYTSGATLAELRRVLLRAGARSVCGVTFCRVVRTV